MNLNYKIANLRYKLWRLSGKILLGKLFGAGFGQKVTRDIDEACGNPAIRSHVLERTLLAQSYIQKYDFDDSFSVEFSREEVFRKRYIYLLKDVIMAPMYGGVWLPNRCFFQQSIGSIRRSHEKISIIEELLTISVKDIDEPVVCIGVFSHYHMLIESIPLILHAIKVYPKLKVLLPTQCPKYLISILEILKIDSSRQIISDNPIQVKKAILVPKHETSGFIPREDLRILKSFLWQYVNKTSNAYPQYIYISRAQCKNRPIANERDLENKLKGLGFEILYFENIPFSEQMSHIYHAKYIVAPHGAGLANLIVARPGTKVLEILSRNWFNTCYAKLSVQSNLHYDYVETFMENNKIFVNTDLVTRKLGHGL